MILKSIQGYGITLVVLSIGLLSLHTGCRSVSPTEGTIDSDSSRPEGVVIFEFGKEDGSDREFRRSGLDGITEYRCRVGVDCSTEAFPEYLYQTYSEYVHNGVERIVISFRLEQTYDDVILRLARGGDETTVVKVDRRKSYLVTNTMLGSTEGFHVGACNLKLGALKKGEHHIELTVADDGKGSASYQWDALSLIAK
jgi:hypothetical protein